MPKVELAAAGSPGCGGPALSAFRSLEKDAFTETKNNNNTLERFGFPTKKMIEIWFSY